MAKSQKNRAKKPLDANSQKLKNFVRKISDKYLEDPNINSVGIGYKEMNGKRTKELAIQFTVDKKLSQAELASAPESLTGITIPDVLNVGGQTIKTDVIQRKYRPCFLSVPLSSLEQDERKRRHDPIKPGISIGNIKVTAGTLGAIVYDNTTSDPLILSNWHVLNGDTGEIGDTIVQPGVFDDSNSSANVIGKLTRSFLGLAGDCAVCSIENRKFATDVLGFPQTSPSKVANPELDDKVIKSGRTTGVTHGIVRRLEVVAKINYGNSTGIQKIGAFEIGVDPAQKPGDGEISLGGDSGSLWLAKDNRGRASATAIGLHFAGEAAGSEDEHALACPIDSVFKKLDISFQQPRPAETTSPMGYKEEFLSKKVPLPKIKSNARGNVLKTGNVNNTLDYTHFSIVMNERRKLCYYAVVNIDGTSLRNMPRKGDKWNYDTRIGSDMQVGNELYKSNNIDRGHMVRRLDAVWGSLAEARRANEDTFYYTNACPQHADLNQREWNDLEEYILGNAGVFDLKVSVFTGPVLRNNDIEYRGVKIPVEFWKVVVFVREDTNELSATAYLLSQKDDMDNLEEVFVYGEFRTYQVPLAKIEGLTNISFGTLKKYDPMVHQVESTGLKPLSSLSQIIF